MEKLRTTRIMMAAVRYVAPGAGHTKSQAAWLLFHRVYIRWNFLPATDYGVCSPYSVAGLCTCFSTLPPIHAL
jgi:hypothetical protein